MIRMKNQTLILGPFGTLMAKNQTMAGSMGADREEKNKKPISLQDTTIRRLRQREDKEDISILFNEKLMVNYLLLF